MKTLYLALTFSLLLMVGSATAQINACNDPNLSTIGTFNAQVSFEVQGKSSAMVWTNIVERGSSGEISYRIDVSTIQFSGDPSVVDATSSAVIFDAIGKTTVTQGVMFGYTPCPLTCDLPTTTRVSEQGCVTRSGSGLATRFIPCADAGCCSRIYTVCCPNGTVSPLVTMTGSDGPFCTIPGGSISTCP